MANGNSIYREIDSDFMSNSNTAILDAAEARMRCGGYNGFSFREIATDVGIKSSSVHYHFPTKENLAAAVIRRYTEQALEAVNADVASGLDPAQAWIKAFRGTLHSKEHMCPCIVLGPSMLDLPAEVSNEVRHFFRAAIDHLVKGGLSPHSAAHLLALISGAMLIASVVGDNGVYDQATRELLQDGDLPTA
jgi:TetR/AcrR family transcriptional repressor of nem operon